MNYNLNDWPWNSNDLQWLVKALSQRPISYLQHSTLTQNKTPDMTHFMYIPIRLLYIDWCLWVFCFVSDFSILWTRMTSPPTCSTSRPLDLRRRVTSRFKHKHSSLWRHTYSAVAVVTDDVVELIVQKPFLTTETNTSLLPYLSTYAHSFRPTHYHILMSPNSFVSFRSLQLFTLCCSKCRVY